MVAKSLAGLLTAVLLTAPQGVGRRTVLIPPADSTTYRLVVDDLRTEAARMFVDSAVLSADPSIASVEALSVPDSVGHASSSGSLTAVVHDRTISTARLRAARSLAVQMRSITEAVGCGAVRHQATVSGRPLKLREQCLAGENFMVALIGVPRQYGPHLPGTLDERGASPGLWSVRVITVDLSGEGAIQTAWDYVFEVGQAGSPRLVRKRALMVAG